MPRPRHTDKDIEAFLRLLESKGWRIEKRKYFWVRCAEGCRCMKTVHLTPSDPNYLRNLQQWVRRCPCWREEDR
jgi:hypothetical protein